MRGNNRKPEKVEIGKCIGFSLGAGECRITTRDAILYALGLGLSQDNQLDEEELKYTYEGHDEFSVLPSYGVVLPKGELMFQALQECPGLPEFNPMMLLHGEHELRLMGPLPLDGVLLHEASIKEVWDKKKAALVVVKVESKDETGRIVCVNESNLFIRGLGGFGGSEQPKETLQKPSRSPDFSVKRKTASGQALLYRLSGDYNPLHADPKFSVLGGFDTPILHGLCTFGVGCFAVLKTACNNDPTCFVSMKGRFNSPVTPGDNLRVDIWASGAHIFFEVVNETTNIKALVNGVIMLSKPPIAAL